MWFICNYCILNVVYATVLIHVCPYVGMKGLLFQQRLCRIQIKTLGGKFAWAWHDLLV